MMTSLTDKPWMMAVKAVITDTEGRHLLLRRSAVSRNFIGVWEWPGGKLDPGADYATGLAREDYAKSAKPKDPSLSPWENLADSLKLSNYHQVAYWEHTLRDYGLGIRVLSDADLLHPPLDMAEVLPKREGVDDPVRELAELEHGRWNVERLAYGWAYAPEKDVIRKLSPYLVPWTALTQEIQGYDVTAITGLPAKLREVGLEVYQLTT